MNSQGACVAFLQYQATDEACASFDLSGKREENTARWLAFLLALNPLQVASKPISVWKL